MCILQSMGISSIIFIIFLICVIFSQLNVLIFIHSFNLLFNLKIEENQGEDTAAECEDSDVVDQEDVRNNREAAPQVVCTKNIELDI